MSAAKEAIPNTPELGRGVVGPAPKALPEDTSDDTMALNPGEQAVQFVPGQDPNGDARVEIGETGHPKFVGLGKEELMKYANDPFWVRLRWILFALFWLLWLAMLVGAIVIIVFAPKCADKLEGPTAGPYYQIQLDQVGSGKFSDVQKEVDYLKQLNVKTVIVSQPLKAEEGGVVDFKAVDTKAGTMDDFKSLLSALKDAGMKVLMQFVPNHSGSKHPWFGKPENENYYVRVAKSQESNWKSRVGTDQSAWSDDATFPEKKYLHQFNVNEPDLNMREPKVIKELNDALRFWYDASVDGFLLSEVSYLLEDLNKLNDASGMINQANADITKQLLDTSNWDGAKNESFVQPIALLDTEQLAVDKGIAYFNKYISVVSTVLAELPENFTAKELQEKIENTQTKVGNKHSIHWRIGGPRLPRPTSKFGLNRAATLALVAASLRGQFVHYYGDEIALVNGVGGAVSDPRRVSMEKFVKPSEGDSEKAKLKQFYVDLFDTVNKFNQSEKGGGSTDFKTDDTKNVFAMKRENEDTVYIIAANLGEAENEVDVSSFLGSSEAEVKVRTPNIANDSALGNFKEGKVKLPGLSGALLAVTRMAA